MNLPETVVLDDARNCAVIPDQTLFPGEIRLLELTAIEEFHDAIYRLCVRGAPAIGIAAAAGLYLAAKAIESTDYQTFYDQFRRAADYLATARPTAVNLFWAIDRMDACVRANADKPVAVMKKALLDEVNALRAADIATCRSIGEYGLTILKPGMGVLTHCNAGQFATIKYGTATAPIYLAHEKGWPLQVYADETRPLLQGARITCLELQAAGVNVTLLCDNMAASLMSQGKVNVIFVGCDRVAANGDAANKIGTLGVAILAKHYGVPIYFCAPTSTIDLNTPDGKGIAIEQRPGQEVTSSWYTRPMAPEGIGVYNPAFDVTPHELISGIITEYGIARAPYGQAFREIFQRKEAHDAGTSF